MAPRFESGFFAHSPAWHRLGNVLDHAPSIEEAIIASGMGWKVEEIPSIEFPGYKGIARTLPNGERKLFGVTHDSWTPLQNLDAFRWFEPLLQDGDIELDAAVSLKDGEVVCITAKITGQTAEILPDDVVNQYLILFNGHVPGEIAVGGRFTAVRVVCNNTLSLATAGIGSEATMRSDMRKVDERTFTCKHTRNIKQNLEIARDAIDFQRRKFSGTVEEWREMAKHPMGTDLYRVYLERVFEKELVKADKVTGKVTKRDLDELRAFPKLLNNFQNGVGTDIPGVAGSVWGGYQAVSEWVSHQRGNDEESRLNSLWFGSNKSLLNKAHKEAMVLIS